MKKAFFILLILSAGSFQLKARYENLLHKTYAQRYPELQPLYGKISDPNMDTAKVLGEINQIARMAIDNNDEDLLLETKLLIAVYYYYRSYQGVYPYDFVTEKLNALVEEARKEKKPWLEARAEGGLASHSLNLKQYEKEFEHYNRMYNVLKDLTPEEYPDKQNSIYHFANALYQFRDYRTAISCLKQTLDDSLPGPGRFYYYNCFNLIGLCYRALNDLDSSSFYFRLVYEKALRKHDEIWVGICSGNLGENYFMQKKYEMAKPLLQKDADIAIAAADHGLASNALMVLAEIGLEQGNIVTAEKQLMQARELAYRSGQYKRLRKLYPLLSKLYLVKGNTGLASIFLDSAFVVRDSMDKEYNSLFMTRARQKVELEQHKASLEEISNQKEIKTLQRNALIIIIVLVMIIALFIYDRQKRRVQEKNEQLIRAQEELEQATRQLYDFTRNIAEKNELIENLQQKITTPDSAALLQLQRSIILTDEQWAEFKNLFDKVHVGYLQRLKNKIPGLTPAETRFIALTKLGLSNKEMSAMLGNSTDAIRQYRSRLRKKLNLSEEDNIEELIEKF